MKMTWSRAGFALALLLSSSSALRAQAPAGPPPPAGSGARPGVDVHELLPDLAMA